RRNHDDAGAELGDAAARHDRARGTHEAEGDRERETRGESGRREAGRKEHEAQRNPFSKRAGRGAIRSGESVRHRLNAGAPAATISGMSPEHDVTVSVYRHVGEANRIELEGEA